MVELVEFCEVFLYVLLRVECGGLASFGSEIAALVKVQALLWATVAIFLVILEV
jgi:hypothetical protein